MPGVAFQYFVSGQILFKQTPWLMCMLFNILIFYLLFYFLIWINVFMFQILLAWL